MFYIDDFADFQYQFLSKPPSIIS